MMPRESHEFSCGDDLGKELIVSSCLFAHDPERFSGFCLIKQVHGCVFYDSEIGRRVIFSHPAVVIAEGDLEHPVEAVFDSPMRAYRMGKAGGRALGGLDHSSVRHAISQAGISFSTDPAYASEINAIRDTAIRAISDLRRHALLEDGQNRSSAPLDVAKRVMRSPRGEIRMSGAEMRVLAEAYVDLLLRPAGGAI